MNSKVWMRKALTMCLTVAIYATYSIAVPASPDKIVGELTISGNATENQLPLVTVNGEVAQSGRAIFSNSTISTGEGSSAVVNVGKSGKIELAPNTTVSLSFDEKGITGDLATGKVTALSADNVNIKTPTGSMAKLNMGESAGSSSQTTDPGTGSGRGWLIFAIVLGGAVAGITLAATSDNNDINIGGGSTVVSPTR